MANDNIKVPRGKAPRYYRNSLRSPGYAASRVVLTFVGSSARKCVRLGLTHFARSTSPIKNLICVDCEANGKSPSTGKLTEFGAVAYPSKAPFHGVLSERKPVKENPDFSIMPRKVFDEKKVFEKFDEWLAGVTKGERPIFVSDNPAFDWQWINDGFWRTLGKNPFGHSARRISDFYAGLVGDFMDTQSWKKLRVTPHDHNPVNDAMGNLEAFERLLNGER